MAADAAREAIHRETAMLDTTELDKSAGVSPKSGAVVQHHTTLCG